MNMTICQTLWVNKKDLLKDNFGWLTPQYHIMGWALSSLKLKQLYPTVNLHTDVAGITLFKDKLNLPYNNFFDDYSNMTSRPNLWALAKLLTYARQEGPFLHVDGDVFAWHKFNKNLMKADLIAQNLEIGTEYYRNSFSPLLSELKSIPKSLKRNLTSQNMFAYNAGIIGGRDNDFFKRYVAEAVRFVKKNNTVESNYNIIFEQLLFYSMAMEEKKTVNCLFEKLFNDNGYKKSEMASFPKVNQLGYLHLLGVFKRDKEICNWVARQLYQENEDLYLRIISLFKKNHFFYNTKVKETHPSIVTDSNNRFVFRRTEKFIKQLTPKFDCNSNMCLKHYVNDSKNSLLKELFKYEQKLSRLCYKFKKIEASTFKRFEAESIKSTDFLLGNSEKQSRATIKRNSHIEIIDTTFDWTTLQFAGDGYFSVRSSTQKDIVIGVIPELFFDGFREVALDELCVNLIVLAEEEISYQQLSALAQSYLPQTEEPDSEKHFNELLLSKMEYLITNKILFVHEGK